MKEKIMYAPTKKYTIVDDFENCSLDLHKLPLTKREIEKEKSLYDKYIKYNQRYWAFRCHILNKYPPPEPIESMKPGVCSFHKVPSTKKEMKKDWNFTFEKKKVYKKYVKYIESVVNKYASKYPKLIKKIKSYLKSSDYLCLYNNGKT